MCDATEAALIQTLKDAELHKAQVGAKYVKITHQHNAAQQAAKAAKRALEKYPERLYWSRPSTRKLSMELVWHIVSMNAHIVWKLYWSDVPSMKLMIDPRHLQLLHVKFFFQSPQVVGFKNDFRSWLQANNPTVDHPWPAVKWKRRVESSSVKGLIQAAKIPRIVWKLGTMTVVFYGPQALVEVSGLIRRPQGWRLTARVDRRNLVLFRRDDATNTFCVPYVALQPALKAVYGGQPKHVVVTWK